MNENVKVCIPSSNEQIVNALVPSNNIRILVVDDEPQIRVLLCKILSSENYQTEEASDGMDALEKWQQAKDQGTDFDLLVSDLRMPRMDGSALFKAIRKTDLKVPIIVLSGHADLEAAYALLEQYQIADFIDKPLTNTKKLFFSVKNVLEKAQLQSALITLNNELEQRVKKRTAELTRESERLKKANLAKIEFQSRMSHELRTPLNAIIGFSQLQNMQLESGEYETAQENMSIIVEAGRHLLRLVDDVLDITRIQQKQLKIKTSVCDLNTTILESIKLVEQKARELNIDIHYQPEKLVGNVDEPRLKQILSNILSNAIKFSHKSGRIEVEMNKQPDNIIEISITDFGVGIAEEEQMLIFEPFTRLKYANKYEINGVGIGLTLCKLLLDEMNSQISVESCVGKGSTFKIHLSQNNK